MASVRVQRPRSVFDAVTSLANVALITIVALKLAGIVTWSWWWVLSPLWIMVAPLALLAGAAQPQVAARAGKVPRPFAAVK